MVKEHSRALSTQSYMTTSAAMIPRMKKVWPPKADIIINLSKKMENG